MKAIYKRELKSYFDSALGYLFIAVFVVLISIYFVANNISKGAPYLSYTIRGAAPVLLFTIPILTMKSFAEDMRNKTDQMLLTSPVKLYQIVIGKFFALGTIYLIPLLYTALLPVAIKLMGGTTFFRVDYLTLVTMFLFGLVFIAMGIFVSSMTESQIIAAVVSFLLTFLMVMWSNLTGYIPSTNFTGLLGIYVIIILIALAIYGTTKSSLFGFLTAFGGIAVSLVVYFIKASLVYDFFHGILDKFDFMTPLTNVAYYNIFDVSGVFFYLSVIAVLVILTIQALNKRRWS